MQMGRRSFKTRLANEMGMNGIYYYHIYFRTELNAKIVRFDRRTEENEIRTIRYPMFSL